MNTLSFNGVTLTPVHRNAQVWLSSAELAEALGYKHENAVTKIYNRNADEFTENMTQVIKNPQLPNLGMRIFSLRGCHLVAMFARTAVAKEFRKWVLDILDREVGEPVMTAPMPVHPTTPTLSKADFAILQTVVRDLSAQMAYPKASELAIWARLRAVCDVSSIHNIRYSDMWTVLGELSRIGRILRPYADFRKSTEKTLIKRICLGDHSAVWEAIQVMDDTADGFSLLADDKAFCALERLALGACDE